MVAGRPHGIARYVTRLAEGLALLRGNAPLPYEPVFLRARETPESAFAGFETVAVSTKFLSPLELALVPLAARRAHASVFHSPSFVGFAGVAFQCPWIVTIHDLIHLHTTGPARRTYYERLLKPFALKARALVTVSEFSRREIVRWLGDVPIELAPNAIDPALLKAPTEEQSRSTLGMLGLQPGKFFFCLSNPKPHKNVDLLLEAYRELPEPRLPLVLGGVEPGHNVAGVRALQRLSDEDCHVLWHGCAAFAFPSKVEGFGLPPVEAAAAGAPLLVSSIPALREALAPLGPRTIEWINPDSREDWTRALGQAARQALPKPPLEGRRLLVEGYSIEKLGQAMDRIYRRVLKLAS
jgi:glycosyltransferase involved in cell wall biosynthesis